MSFCSIYRKITSFIIAARIEPLAAKLPPLHFSACCDEDHNIILEIYPTNRVGLGMTDDCRLHNNDRLSKTHYNANDPTASSTIPLLVMTAAVHLGRGLLPCLKPICCVTLPRFSDNYSSVEIRNAKQPTERLRAHESR